MLFASLLKRVFDVFFRKKKSRQISVEHNISGFDVQLIFWVGIKLHLLIISTITIELSTVLIDCSLD